MSIKINGISYPNTVDGMLADSIMARPFKRYITRSGLAPDLNFLTSPRSEKILYENYLHPKAPTTLNISGAEAKKVQEEFKDQKWSDKKRLKAYRAAIERVQDLVRGVIESDRLTGTTFTFFDSKEFHEVHVKNLRKVMKLDRKKMIFLGFENVGEKKLRDALSDAAIKTAIGKKTEGKKAFKKVVALEPKGSLGAAINPEKLKDTFIKYKVFAA